VVSTFFPQPKKPAQRLKLPEQQYARINASTKESVQRHVFCKVKVFLPGKENGAP